jgi:hypothetical protein
MTEKKKRGRPPGPPRRFARVFVSLADWAVEALERIRIAENRRTRADTARVILEDALKKRERGEP